jgi:hypothetical protein
MRELPDRAWVEGAAGQGAGQGGESPARRGSRAPPVKTRARGHRRPGRGLQRAAGQGAAQRRRRPGCRPGRGLEGATGQGAARVRRRPGCRPGDPGSWEPPASAWIEDTAGEDAGSRTPAPTHRWRRQRGIDMPLNAESKRVFPVAIALAHTSGVASSSSPRAPPSGPPVPPLPRRRPPRRRRWWGRHRSCRPPRPPHRAPGTHSRYTSSSSLRPNSRPPIADCVISGPCYFT